MANGNLKELRYGLAAANGRRPIAWTKKQKRFIRIRYQEGSSLRELANFFGLNSHGPMNALVREQGWLRRKVDSKSAMLRKEFITNLSKYNKIYQKEGKVAADVADVVCSKLGIMPDSTLYAETGKLIRKFGIKKHVSELSKGSFRKQSLRQMTQSRIYALVNQNVDSMSYVEYRHCVSKLSVVTRRHWAEYPHIMEMWGEPDTSIDHIYSVNAGYYGKDRKGRDRVVPLRIMCHPCNMRYMCRIANSSKCFKCGISLRELIANIKAFNSEYGDPFRLL